MEISNDELESVINRAVAAGIQAAFTQRKKQNKEKTERYNDTFAVMKNYNDAKFCLEHTADGATKLSTLIKLRHIDDALKVIKQRRQQQNREIEYEAFKMYFIDEMDYETISEKLDTGKNTPRRWITGIIGELSTMFWGIDSDL